MQALLLEEHKAYVAMTNAWTAYIDAPVGIEADEAHRHWAEANAIWKATKYTLAERAAGR